MRGGRINTDAVDNSAGVDTSDHEVNLKILLAGLHKQNLVDDCQTLFESLTEAVCADVLQDNIEQSLCLSLDQIRCQADPALFMQVAERLEAAGFLDRSVESFPEAKDVMARPGQALTRPELAVLMAAAKMFLVRQLQKRPEHLDVARYQPYLAAYFPAPLRERFGAHLAAHPLAAEIKATVIANRIVNQAGSGFWPWTTAKTAAFSVSSTLTWRSTRLWPPKRCGQGWRRWGPSWLPNSVTNACCIWSRRCPDFACGRQPGSPPSRPTPTR